MKKFLIKTFVLGIPLIVFFLIPMIVLKISGENYTSINDIIKKDDKYLIGYAYNENNYNFLKWESLITKPKHDVVALGSSRVLEFRKDMFNKTFYNAGFTIVSISEFVPFLESIPKSKYPDVLLVSLDQWMFNENWDSLKSGSTDKSKWENSFIKNAPISTINTMWSDLLNGKFSFFNNHKYIDDDTKRVGLSAKKNNRGFRNDGSLLYGNHVVNLLSGRSTYLDSFLNETYINIDKGYKRFAYGSKINKNALVELDNLMKFCKSNKIHLVSFLPPFANRINDMLNKKGDYLYMNKIPEEVEPLINNYGFEFWDLSHLNTYYSNDNEVLDGYHGGEVSYLKMLIYMVENGSVLKNYTDLEKLKQDISKKINNYSVYGN